MVRALNSTMLYVFFLRKWQPAIKKKILLKIVEKNPEKETTTVIEYTHQKPETKNQKLALNGLLHIQSAIHADHLPGNIGAHFRG